MGLTITKLQNGNVKITGGNLDYTLLPSMHVYRNKSISIDGADVLSDGKSKDTFSASSVDKLVLLDSSEILSPTGQELYESLKNDFFFVGTWTPQLSILDQIEAIATVNEAYEAGVGVMTPQLYSELTGQKGVADLTQITSNNQPYRRRVNGNEVIWLDSILKYINVGGAPFAALSDTTVFITFFPENDHCLIGEGDVSDRAWRSRTSTSSADSGFGTTIYYHDGVAQGWATQTDVQNALVYDAWNLVSIDGASFATWQGFNLNWHNSTSSAAMLGYVANIFIMQNSLNGTDRSAIESILLANMANLAFPNYTENSTTVTLDTPDTAVTGVEYVQSSDEITFVHWGIVSSTSKLVHLDRATLTVNSETQLNPIGLYGVQGMTYIPTLDVYLLNVNNQFYSVSKAGALIQSYGMPVGTALEDAGLDWYDGHVYYRDTTDPTKIRKCTIDGSVMTLVSSVDFATKSGAADSGLNVNSDGFTVWEGTLMRQYGWDGVLQLEIPSTGSQVNSTEGITITPSGVVYACRDDWFHNAVPNGNRIWSYEEV